MTLEHVLTLMLIQGTLGAIDTVYYHEYRFSLPSRTEITGPELRLHAFRDFLYATLYATLPFIAYRGLWAFALAAMLIAEIALTLVDFAVEDDVRRPFGGVPKGERTMHTVIAILYGAVLAGLVPWIVVQGALPTSFHLHGEASTWQRVVFPIMSAGALLSGIRDWGAQAGWKG